MKGNNLNPKCANLSSSMNYIENALIVIWKTENV